MMLRVAAALILAATLAAPAAAQLNRQQNNRQPIEITADVLDVDQEKRVAVFSGRVEVVQGDTRLKADRLRVHYREGAQQAATPTPPSQRRQAQNQPQQPAGNGISRIEAFGNVFISSQEETGQGETGVYDVDRRIVTLEGARVVLTQKNNVLVGTKVVMNLDTGRSQIVSTPVAGRTESGRVRGVFVPEGGEGAPGQSQQRR